MKQCYLILICEFGNLFPLFAINKHLILWDQAISLKIKIGCALACKGCITLSLVII